MENQNNQQMPVVQPTAPAPGEQAPVGKSMSRSDLAGIIAVSLFVLCFVVPGMGFLGIIIFIVGALAAANVLKDAAKTSKTANVAVKFFKIAAGIAIGFVTLIIAGIAFLFFLISTGNFDVGS